MCPELAAGGQTRRLLADPGRFSLKSVGTYLENHSLAESPDSGVLDMVALNPSGGSLRGSPVFLRMAVGTRRLCASLPQLPQTPRSPWFPFAPGGDQLPEHCPCIPVSLRFPAETLEGSREPVNSCVGGGHTS